MQVNFFAKHRIFSDNYILRGKPEESALGNALLSLAYWLAQTYSSILDVYVTDNTLSTGNLKLFLNTAFFMLIIQIF